MLRNFSGLQTLYCSNHSPYIRGLSTIVLLYFFLFSSGSQNCWSNPSVSQAIGCCRDHSVKSRMLLIWHPRTTYLFINSLLISVMCNDQSFYLWAACPTADLLPRTISVLEQFFYLNHRFPPGCFVWLVPGDFILSNVDQKWILNISDIYFIKFWCCVHNGISHPL